MLSLLLLALLQAPPPRPALPCLHSEHPCAAPPAPAPVLYTREPKSRTAFWVGLGLVGAGTTLAVLSATALQSSDPAGPLAVPCGTDPVLAQGRPIAPCIVNHAVLATGLALTGGGATLMIYGGRTVEVIVAPTFTSSAVAVRLRF